MITVLRIIVLLLISTIIIYPQNDEWNFSGQIQLRSELDGRDFSNKTHPLTFASLRTRVGVEKSFMEKVNFFVQFQDSRIFGEEPNTLAPIDNIDLHQGYVYLKDLFDWDMDVQAGRFEVVYGTERFFGAVGWHYVGRSWDGVRFRFNPGFKLDLFALTHTESVSYIGNATPAAYPISAPATPSYSVYGFWQSANLNQQNQLDIFGYYEINRNKINMTDLVLDRFTLGINHVGNFNSISTIFEAAYQFGSIGALDVSAYLLSAQGNFNFNGGKIGIGADLISGTGSGSSKVKNFSPTFGTNHKFYGYMDYFINIPGNTFGGGLNDFYLKVSLLPADSKFNASVDIHYFMANQPITITSVSDPVGREESSFGQEVDLTVKYNFIKGTTITWGGSLFFPGELMKTFFSPREDTAFWSYVMITSNL